MNNCRYSNCCTLPDDYRRYIFRYLVVPVVVTALVAAVLVPTIVSYFNHAREMENAKARISCLEGNYATNSSACRKVGCLWLPVVGQYPSCYFPPVEDHGYMVLSTTPTPSGELVELARIPRSATPVPNSMDQLILEIIEYGEDMLRVRVTVPGQDRYEPPVPLQLPERQKGGGGARYSVSVRLGEEGDQRQVFALKIVRVATGTLVFDTSIGGFSFAEQFLQVATALPSNQVYGLGEHSHTSFKHSFDHTVWPMFSRDQPPGPGAAVNLHGVHPVYYVLEDDHNAHAVFWMNSNAMEAEMIPLPGIALRSIGGIMDLFFFLGPHPLDVVRQYTQVVGRPAMPPYWALGFHLSWNGYGNLATMQATITRTSRHGIPQDGLWGDVEVLERAKTFTVSGGDFEGLPEYVEQQHHRGLHFGVVLHPAINAELGAEYPVHQRGLAEDVYLKWSSAEDVPGDNHLAGDVMLGYLWPDNRTAFPDFLRNATAGWWAREVHLYRQQLHFDALCLDINEPTNFGTNEEKPWNWPQGRPPWSLSCPRSQWDDPPFTTRAAGAKRLSDRTVCMTGAQGEGGRFLHYDVHNLHGLAQARPTLGGLEAATGQRGLVVSRSTFPSSGRWAGHWLAHNAATWTFLRISVVGVLEFNIFGIPYVGADICGYFEDTTEELCGRWMQLGAFYPFSRNHNGGHFLQQDPGRWPSVGAASRAALRLRYLLLPYLYTLHHHAHIAASLVLRSLAFQFPEDASGRGVDTQFLWGAALLVAPVLTEGAVEQDVYLPGTGIWYCFHKGYMVETSDGWTRVAATLSDPVPLFVAGGTILPTQRPAANTKLARQQPLGLVVAPDQLGEARGEMFWDDGISIDTDESGDYYMAEFYYYQNSISWKVTHPDVASSRGLRFSDARVFGVLERPYQVLVNGAPSTRGDWHYDAPMQVLHLYDLEIPVDENFDVSWTTKTDDLLLPCPISYADWDESLPVTEGMCTERHCNWNLNNAVECSQRLPEEADPRIAGPVVFTPNGGFSVPLRAPPPATFQDPLKDLMFTVEPLSDHLLAFKVFDPNNKRYEVPITLNLPLSAATSPLYEVVLGSEEEGEPFSFSVTRKDTQTVLFDTRLGGLVFEDQFLSITTLLASRNVYGLGETSHSSFRRHFDGLVKGVFARDQPPSLDSDMNLYGTHPFYECIENDGNSHGVLFLNSNAMDYQLLDYPALTLRSIGGILQFYMFLGPTPEQVTQQYTALIGFPTMPPYWALGFQLSRYGYEDVAHMQAAADRTKALQIPFDVQYADIDYMEDQKDFTIDQEHFGRLPQYVDQLHEDGLRFIIILDPAINVELSASAYPPHARAAAQGVYIEWSEDTPQHVLDDNNGGDSTIMLGYVWPENRTAFPNWHKQATQEWWAEEVRLFHSILSFDGLWIDMNEPAVFSTNMDEPWNWPDWQEGSWNLKCPTSKWDDPPYVTKAGSLAPSFRMSDKTLCLSAEETPYRHYDVHNLYGWAQARTSISAVRAATGERSVVISRSTFVGSGRWAGHWLGDNRSDWPDMHRSIIGMLEFNLFGIPYIGADICGFFGEATEELCGRWMQLGAFYPFSRNHNTIDMPDQDPGMWPDTVGKWSKEVLETRYRLLPFLYTLFYQASTKGGTVVRSLAHEFPKDRVALEVDNQFLWGASLMVSPVLTEAVTQRTVYFPHAAWYDYYTGAPVELTEQWIIVPAPLDVIPLHVRGGCILPLQGPAPTTLLSRKNPMTLLVALDLNRNAKGELFWDDGVTTATVANNRFSLVHFNFRESTLTMEVLVNHHEDLGSLRLRDIHFLGIEQEPVMIHTDGLTLFDWTYNITTMALVVTLEPMMDMNQNMIIQLEGIWWNDGGKS